ncbi:MAG TPA: sigma-54-dependent Fis family transcriptional regulator, partial [Bacteroidetes bacterium]|nr:sigma-54-dependent Fis family transcriptional regulator [Bacteroidota bacterium]
EDQENVRQVFLNLLKRNGYAVTEAANGKTAIEQLKKKHFDLVLTDLRMEPVDGMEVLRQARKIAPETEVVVITGFGTVSGGVEAMKLGAYDYLEKPVESEKLLFIIRRAIEKKELVYKVEQLQKELREKYAFDHIVGKSEKMIDVLKIISQIASTDSTILIQGESGTGKELVARAIHENSARKNQPWVAVNCGGFVDSLLESELFGHVKGAFTGAIRDKIGLVQQAHRGTLFLDEISEMSLPMQVKLLRFLESSEVRQVGGSASMQVDVRLIAATNKDLRKAVKAKTFREDLFYRIHVIPLTLPPLRERKDDVELLSHHFLEEFNRKLNKSIKGFSKRAMVLLRNYAWPGNVRELRNVIERAVALTRNEKIQTEDLPFYDSDQRIFQSLGAGNAVISLRELEKRYIQQIMQKAKGDQKKAAEWMGISQTTLWRKLKK